MTNTPLVARDAVERILKENPRQSAAEIARQIGVSRQRVFQILDGWEYEPVTYWRKKRKPK